MRLLARPFSRQFARQTARVLRDPWGFAWQTLKAFRANQGLLLSGAVAYYALLSIVPLLILSVIGLSHWVEQAQLLQTVGRYLEWLVPGQSAAVVAELARFLNPERQERKTIADMIMEELARKEAGMGGIGADMDGDAMGAHETQLDPKVIHVYTELGKLLQRYKSGPLPKAFKIVPSLVDWEEIVFLMNPDDWSPVAVYAATRLFASNLNPAMAQRFYMLVLAPRISADIAANKKLNYHLYMAVKKALYKPKAFFKGLLLPLCDSRACTLREATILGSVLQKVSIPVFHASAALLIMSEMDYSGPLSIFMRVLINKKYALPYRVVDAVVNHFLRFVTDKRELPVLWHNCLLTFVQRYKAIITEEQRDLMKGLMAVHFHHLITPEVRRELFADRARGIRSFEQPDAEMAM